MSQMHDTFQAHVDEMVHTLEAHINQARAITIENLPDLGDVDAQIYFGAAEPNIPYIDIWLPADFARLEVCRVALEADGWRKINHFQTGITWSDTYKHDFWPYRVNLLMNIWITGSTCRVNKIAIKEEPVYEWICGEAVQENTHVEG
jgi:hypothetical protein